MDLSPGAVIAGRYKVERKVGAGGMGEVWLGEHTAVGVRVAVKTLLAEPGADHEVVARFKREAYLLGKVKSDHIARILDFVTDEQYGTVLVMEFVDGESLAKVLQYKKLSVEETIELGADVAAGLVDLHHAHIIHRDLKPGNVILQPLADGRKRAVIVDFGVSRMLAEVGNEEEEITGITKAGMALGTLEYMSPEQILSSRDAKTTADIYALGAILWRAVNGKHIFGDIYDVDLAQKKIRTDPPELSLGRTDRIGRGLVACIARAIKRRPSERYQKAEDLLADLSQLRDLARAAALDLDSATTQDATSSAVIQELASGPSRPVATDVAAPAEASSKRSAEALAPAASTSVSAASASLVSPEPPRRRGISGAVVGVGLLVALGGGAALGTLWQRKQASVAQESAPATSTQPSAIASAPAAASAPAPAASESAAPAASASAAAAEADAGPPPIDLDALDPASRAALEGTMPTTRGAPLYGAQDGGTHVAGKVPDAGAAPAPPPAVSSKVSPIGSVLF